MTKLTKRSVEALTPQASDYITFDAELKGFGLRVLPSGKKTYLVQYRSGGRTRRVKIGPHGVLTADEARTKARSLLGAVADGENPAQEISARRGAPPMSEVCDRFYNDHVLPRCKPSSQREYKRLIENVIKPALGTFKVVDVTRTDIANLHHSQRETPYQANRALSLLSKLFNLAEVWGLRPDGSNPCRHVRKYTEQKRETFLSAAEVSRLGQALEAARADGSESPQVVGAFQLLLLTGCRLSEIQTLKWGYVVGEYLCLPDTKTGARKIPLPPAAGAILQQLPRVRGNDHVITGEVEGQPITDLQRPWRRLRTRAGLEHVRIHDLRHTYASNAVMQGYSIPMVGKLLGHTQIQTTMRYAHIADDPLKQAARDVSEVLSRGLQLPAASARPQLSLVK